MKSAIYIEDGVTQVVLTPEDRWEMTATTAIYEALSKAKVSVYRGQFYEVNGGWTMHQPSSIANNASVIIRVSPEPADG